MLLKTRHKIALASLAFRLVRTGRKLCGKGLQGRFKRGSFYWELDLREVVDFMIYISGGFEKYLSRFIRRNVRPGDVVMDIGANIGAHTLPMGQSAGAKGHVYAIEATEYAYSKLCANVALNPSIKERISALHCVLKPPGHEEDHGAREPFIHSSWPFESKEERHPSHQGVFKSIGDAQAMTLDELVADKDIDRLDLIKIDVDGHEWDVLSGGESTFKEMQPVIIMELAPDYHEPEHEKGFKQIHAFLSGLGYGFYNFKGSQLPREAEALAKTIPNGASVNVVVVPKAGRALRFG